MDNDNQIIIDLLREQNQTLHKLLEFHQRQEKIAFRNAVIHIILQAIPYIILIVIGYFLYMGLKSYLDAINNSIETIHKTVQDSYFSIQTIIDKITSLPGEIGQKLTSLPGTIGSTVQNLFK